MNATTAATPTTTRRATTVHRATAAVLAAGPTLSIALVAAVRGSIYLPSEYAWIAGVAVLFAWSPLAPAVPALVLQDHLDAARSTSGPLGHLLGLQRLVRGGGRPAALVRASLLGFALGVATGVALLVS